MVSLSATEFSDEEYGTLSIATTHTQTKFTLQVVDKFVKRYPNVHFQMHQCTPDESVEMAAKGEVEALFGLKQLKRVKILSKCHVTNGRSIMFLKGIP